mmetsp:Transcript_18498/g.26125  ORF Transcript_18498/g.26125 Transcript_18498/m.26125 type:complete len:98 (-) Transcript_18498:642-935(-)
MILHGRKVFAVIVTSTALRSTFSTAAAMSTSSSGRVPDRMALPNALQKTSNFASAKMIQLDLAQDNVSEIKECMASDMISNHCGNHGSLAFVVRRPG